MSPLPRSGALLVSSLLFSCVAMAQDTREPGEDAPTGHTPEEVELDEQTGSLQIGDVQLADAYAAVEALQLVDASVDVAVRERVQRHRGGRRRVLEVTIETRSADEETADSAVLTFDAESLAPVMPLTIEEDDASDTPLYWLEAGRDRRGPPAHARNGGNRRTEGQARGRHNAAPHALPVYWSSRHVGPIYWAAESTPTETPLYWNDAVPTPADTAADTAAELPMLPYDRVAE